eukprot:IDg11785t1
MRAAAAHFAGDHNFRNFCKADPAVDNFVRVLYEVDVRCDGDGDGDADGEHAIYYIFVRGQAFLWHQVRCMAAVLFEVGRGYERPDIVRRMLANVREGSGAFATGKPQYRMASPVPLLLDECAYPPSVLQFAVEGFDMTGSRSLSDALKSSPFVRADAETAKLYAEARLQASVAHALLKGNDESDVVFNGENEADRQEKPFGMFRTPRSFLLDVPVQSKHVPFQERSKEEHSKACTVVLHSIARNDFADDAHAVHAARIAKATVASGSAHAHIQRISRGCERYL